MNSSVRGSAGAAAAMFAVGTLAALSSVVNRYPLYGGQAVRYALAALLLVAVARARGLGFVRLGARETLLLLSLASTGLVLFNVCVVQATRHASPALVGTIVGAVPVALALVGPLLARSRPSGRVVLAALVVVAGATVATGLGSGSPAGLLYAVGALACEACFSLLAIPLLPKLGPVRVSAYTVAVAVPLLLVAGVVADGGALLRAPSAAEAAALLYLGTVVSAGAFILWYDALPRLGADRAGLFAGLVPVGAIATTVLLGLGSPTASELAGAAVVIAGLALGLTAGRPAAAPEAPAAAASAARPGRRRRRAEAPAPPERRAGARAAAQDRAPRRGRLTAASRHARLVKLRDGRLPARRPGRYHQ
ncbi:MAG TPA: DMT family transporter [Actinomycetota bacterium]|jgi:drug/metabolite transporter (DMT)-like permease